MYYHITYQLEKQIGSLEGKFRNLYQEDNYFVLLYKQTPQLLHFVCIASINPGAMKAPISMVRYWLDPILYGLIGESADVERLKVDELDRDQLSECLRQSVRFMENFDVFLNLGRQFMLNLAEYSSVYIKDPSKFNEGDHKVSQSIEIADLKNNLFLINLNKTTDEAFVLAKLIQRLIDEHQAISTSYFQMSPHEDLAFDPVAKLTDPAFVRVALGKIVVIRLDLAEPSEQSLFGFQAPLIFPIHHLSKLVPVILMMETRLSDRLVENLAQQVDAVIITDQ